jgi:hypothetical protein
MDNVQKHNTCKSIFALKFCTACFNQCGHHQVLKIIDEGTALLSLLLRFLLSPLDACMCLSWWVVFPLAECCTAYLVEDHICRNM